MDLSSQAAKTAICAITWREDGTACVEPLTLPAVDEAVISACCSSAVKVGIDCPLGWPEPFISAISVHRDGGRWPGGKPQEMVYRATDKHVHEQVGRWPLMVAADKIGWVAVRRRAARCAARPRAAQWTGPEAVWCARCIRRPPRGAGASCRQGSKTNPELLAGLVGAVCAAMPGLSLTDGAEDTCRSSNHGSTRWCAP